MHRSGTSAVTRALCELGADCGPEEQLLPANAGNPLGYFEHEPLVRLNDRVLAHFGGRWDRPPAPTSDFAATDDEELVALRAEARDLLAAAFGDREASPPGPWIIKDPRLCLTLPFWQPLLPNGTRYLLCVRNPLNVAASLTKRNRFDVGQGLRLWLTYVSASVVHARPPVTVVSYDHLFGEEPTQLRKLARLVRDTTGSGTAETLPSDDTLRALLAPELRHHQNPVDEVFHWPGVAALYAALLHEALEDRDARPALMTAIARAAREPRADESPDGVRAARERADALQATLNVVREQLGHATGALEQLRADIERERNESQQRLEQWQLDHSNEVQRQAEAITRLYEDNERLREDANAASVERSASEIRRLDSELAAAKARCRELEAESEAARAEADEARRQLRDNQRDLAGQRILLERESAERRILNGALQQARRLFEEVRASNRWRVGNSLIDTWRRITFRPRPALAAEVLADLLDGYAATSADAAQSAGLDGTRDRIDIVVCVHNALDDVRRCLQSLVRHTPRPAQFILVDDGSEDETRRLLEQFRDTHADRCRLIRHDAALGYTRSANHGLRESSASWVVLLNSDTIVTRGWIAGLCEAAGQDPSIGLVGPLSNAASYQSVPETRASDGSWSVNPLPAGWTTDTMAQLVREASPRRFPTVPVLNGFCLMISRRVIDTIGYLDEAAFPRGYGEENDFALRATEAGFRLVVADHTWVFHAKSRSFGTSDRDALSRAGRAALEQKHGKGRIARLTLEIEHNEQLQQSRRQIADAMAIQDPSGVHAPAHASGSAGTACDILFLLPVRGGGGGAHSVVQEATGLRDLGVNARVAVRTTHVGLYRAAYPGLPVDMFQPFDNVTELVRLARGSRVAVATIFKSVRLLGSIVAADPSIVPGYYIQDYEPWFCEEGSPERLEAEISYTAIDGMVCFAKTDWLRETVTSRHGVAVRKVVPSLDHSVFFPLDSRQDRPVRIVAMVRPSTPRRAPERTMRVLQAVAAATAGDVEIHIFGCEDEEIASAGLLRSFPFRNHGVLTRELVADRLRSCHVFVDLSDYQAFGRTGLEAMACGCAVILPGNCGTSEYAIDGRNAVLINTKSEAGCVQALRELATDGTRRQALAAEALKTASRYSIDAAARSILDLFPVADADNRDRSGGPVATGQYSQSDGHLTG